MVDGGVSGLQLFAAVVAGQEYDGAEDSALVHHASVGARVVFERSRVALLFPSGRGFVAHGQLSSVCLSIVNILNFSEKMSRAMMRKTAPRSTVAGSLEIPSYRE